jgi:hypothetical protein
MKAKIFTKGKKSQIFLQNGDVHTSKTGESKSDFTKRVSKIVENDLLDTIELKEVTLKSLKSLTTVSIEKTYPTSQGLFQEFLGEVLTSRGIELPVAEAAPKAAPKADEPKTERQVAIEEFKASKDYAAALKNVGKDVSYSVKAHKKEQKGTIKGLSINKKLTKFYYTVLNARTKKRECCAVQNVKF